MTDASAITPDCIASPPSLSTRRRFRILLSLIGVYLIIAFAAPIITGETGFLLLNSGWREVDQHWLYGCVILIAGWTALGPGRIALRAVQGLIAVGWLLLAWQVGLTMSPNWKFELVLTTAVCAAVASTTFVALIVVRCCFGKMLVLEDEPIRPNARRFQFSLATLFFVMLLICATLTLFGWIDPKYKNDFSLKFAWYYLTTSRQWSIWKVSLGPLLIAAACLPVFLSYRKRSFLWALGLSAVAIIASMMMDPFVRANVLYPLFQGMPLLPWAIDYYLVPQITNLVTVIVCLLTAAVAMRWLGYRISAETARDVRAGTLP